MTRSVAAFCGDTQNMYLNARKSHIHTQIGARTLCETLRHGFGRTRAEDGRAGEERQRFESGDDEAGAASRRSVGAVHFPSGRCGGDGLCALCGDGPGGRDEGVCEKTCGGEAHRDPAARGEARRRGALRRQGRGPQGEYGVAAAGRLSTV
ncbi:hypothetical protein M885DRAFT_3334 [Pelagophyceae sp. CCMP2097]|nr:hypothetical protein M885DRAFT_3334 [Pelagophyceae sp. CCMP2097]